jgi:DNA-binding transcriptional ArsR family regulator
MKSSTAIASLGALAHEHRLEIYRQLIKQGPDGQPAGAIGARIGLTPSSLTFHLQVLQRAGLIKQARSGRQLFYSADFAAMNDLVGYLTDECCVGSAACAPGCAPARRPKSQKAA